MKVIVPIHSYLTSNRRAKYAIECIKSIIYSFEQFRFREMCKIIIIYHIPCPRITTDVYQNVCSGYKNVELYKLSFPFRYDEYLLYLSRLISPEDILIFSDDTTLFHSIKVSLLVSLLSSRVILKHSIYILPSHIEHFEAFLTKEEDIAPIIKMEEKKENLNEITLYGLFLIKHITTGKLPPYEKVIDLDPYKLSYQFYLPERF